MNNRHLIISIFSVFFALQTYAQESSIIIKLKTGVNKSQLENMLKTRHNFKPVFHWHQQTKKLNSSRLSNIYSIECSNPTEQSILLKQLNKLPGVIYAEQKPTVKLFETTDDPYATSQYYLGQINIFDAWDITTGDSTVTIGIVDTGTDFTHDDLADKVAINRNDPINGIDDDLDGFTDNYYGWDLSENNNNAQADINGHGAIVAGIAAASTNNSLGIAGVGYNIRYLPVKTMNSEGQLNTAWEGIVYAADHGADIIVCSWGGVVPTQFGKDVIDYATYDKNSLIVAAAGNSGNTDVYYPAAYNEVLSVAASNVNDQKWSGSTYGHAIDICAPGESIYSTNLGNSYITGNGTSFAAPSAAALAALVKHQRPNLTALQIKQQIVNTTYYLDTIPQNVIYAGKLGSGRLDAFAALTDTMISGLQLHNFNFEGSTNASDTIFIIGRITNHLKSAALNATITSLSSYATVLTPNINIGILQTNEHFEFANNELKVKLHSNLPHDEEITIRFAIDDDKKIRYRYYSFIANQSWIDVTENNLNITLPANGRLGFNTLSPIQGNGIWIDGLRNMVWDAGIIHGNNTTQTLSTFSNTEPFHIVQGNSYLSDPRWDYVSQAVMTDTNKNHSMALKIIQQAKFTNTLGLQRTIFLHYTYINQSENDYNDFHAGAFFDWDLNNSTKNFSYFDNESNTAICKDSDNSLYVGVKILDKPFHQYAFELDNETEGINITDGFTTEERWFALSNERPTAGGMQGNDIAHMVATNGETFASGDTLNVTLVICAAFHESDLINTMNEAEQFYVGTTNIKKPPKQTFVIYPNPSSGTIYIDAKQEIKTIYIRDISGKIIYSTMPGSKHCRLWPDLKNGMYIVQIEHINNKFSYGKIIIELP